MRVRKCVSCGAPLGEIAEDATSATCEFCGAVNEPTVLRRGVQRVQIVLDASVGRQATGRAVRRAATAGVFASLFGSLVALGGVGAGVFGVWTALRSAFPARVPAVPGTRVWTPANLGQLTARGRQPLETAAPLGGYARIDPAAQLPWAVRIAQGWSPDARLERIDASGIAPDGTVNTTAAEGEVTYRFVSPARIADYWKQADLSSQVQVLTEMWVIAKGGGALVQAISSRPWGEAAPPAPSVLSLADMMARARARLPPRPFYRGYMIHSGGEGWVWYLSTLSGRESIPRIRAADGRVWPYTTPAGGDTGAATTSTARPPARAPKGYTR